MVPLADRHRTPVRSAPVRRALGRLATLLALTAGVAVMAPAPALAATSVRTTPGNPAAAVAAKRPVVLQRIAVIRTDITRARAAALTAGLPAAQARARTQALAAAQTRLTLASLGASSARTTVQLGRAATLAEQVAPTALPTPAEALARGRAVLATTAGLRPGLEDLDVRASVGESNGFDVSAWADPARAGLAKAVQAETLATRVLDAVTAAGTVSTRDAADLVSAETLASDATTLAAAAREAVAAANGS